MTRECKVWRCYFGNGPNDEPIQLVEVVNNLNRTRSDPTAVTNCYVSVSVCRKMACEIFALLEDKFRLMSMEFSVLPWLPWSLSHSVESISGLCFQKIKYLFRRMILDFPVDISEYCTQAMYAWNLPEFTFRNAESIAVGITVQLRANTGVWCCVSNTGTSVLAWPQFTRRYDWESVKANTKCDLIKKGDSSPGAGVRYVIDFYYWIGTREWLGTWKWQGTREWKKALVARGKLCNFKPKSLFLLAIIDMLWILFEYENMMRQKLFKKCL